ncbi:hypothetical protein [Streptomyces sp. NBC_00847]|uniref:hypothetical protein n=1 Tax=Streptomyces sp. NBC_00847 TaxID=2975850 RepID=UPI00225DE5D0|nr:hypothetical protein [Streptomyces sp. NBC_00847]MCX4886077.1 hypothetical protein [Streptomyces sp. NBC_00847]
MRNGSAAVLAQTPAHVVPWRNPEGDFATTYVNTVRGRTTGQLNSIDQIADIADGVLSQMKDGTAVLLSGTIESVRLFERVHPNYPDADWMLPSATVRVSSGTGAEVIVTLNGRHYEEVWGYLVMGRRFGFAGTVRRPEPDTLTVIDFTRLLMTRTDVLTPEAYDVQRMAVAL